MTLDPAGGPTRGVSVRDLDAAAPALLTDLYELTMGESYVAEGIAERPATFQLFCRRLPPGWGYLVAAGLDDALSYLEGLRFTRRRAGLPRDDGPASRRVPRPARAPPLHR